ncbi:MAG: acetoacetate decarboxylase family protein [Nevskia sp.]|nr:acetoacetate decarboxylase family protein [Nevskia sp.]
MPDTGHLTLGRLGYSMGADAPAYPPPPYYYRNARSLSVTFETDREAVRQALPAGLGVTATPTADLSFFEYPFTTLGSYREAILSLLVEHRGRQMLYIQQIMVDAEPPLLAGREIWGFPKKLAAIEFGVDRDMFYGTMARPAKIRLASAVVRPERPAAVIAPQPPVASLRLIPATEGAGHRPLCAEIIETLPEVKVHEAWEGTGSASFPEQSALDPWSRFPVRRVIGATTRVYDMLLPGGKVIERLE